MYFVDFSETRDWDDDERGEFYTINDRHLYRKRRSDRIVPCSFRTNSYESSSSDGSDYRETVHRVADDPDHPFWDIGYRLYETDDSWEYDSGLSIIPGSNSDSENYSDDDNPAI
jgi:hypothetical protein